jgi:hypothetical protein
MTFTKSVTFELCARELHEISAAIIRNSARNGLVYADMSYRNFFLFLSFIPALLSFKYTYRYGMFPNNASEKWGTEKITSSRRGIRTELAREGKAPC